MKWAKTKRNQTNTYCRNPKEQRTSSVTPDAVVVKKLTV